jgi:Flp pilus assembly protein TadG
MTLCRLRAEGLHAMSRQLTLLARSRRRRQPPGARNGATAVEFAMVAPAFFLLMLAAFEFGRLHVIRHTADNAAYEAARHAMVPGATAAEAISKANSILGVVGTRSANVTVVPAVLDPSVEQVTVTIDVPMNQNGLLAPRFTRNTTIRAVSTLKTERVEN